MNWNHHAGVQRKPFNTTCRYNVVINLVTLITWIIYVSLTAINTTGTGNNNRDPSEGKEVPTPVYLKLSPRTHSRRRASREVFFLPRRYRRHVTRKVKDMRPLIQACFDLRKKDSQARQYSIQSRKWIVFSECGWKMAPLWNMVLRLKYKNVIL